MILDQTVKKIKTPFGARLGFGLVLGKKKEILTLRTMLLDHISYTSSFVLCFTYMVCYTCYLLVAWFPLFFFIDRYVTYINSCFSTMSVMYLT